MSDFVKLLLPVEWLYMLIHWIVNVIARAFPVFTYVSCHNLSHTTTSANLSHTFSFISLRHPTFWPTSYSSSDVYPNGLPTDYSVIATFKITKDEARASWNLWQVSDPEGRDLVGLRFNGDSRTLDFFYRSPSNTQMLRTFHGVEKLFDGEWHKLALSVKGDHAKLLVDCEEVSTEPVNEPRPVILRGYTSIVKRAAGDRSVSVSHTQECYFMFRLQPSTSVDVFLE